MPKQHGRKFFTALLALVFALSTSAAFAHNFALIPDAFTLAPGSQSRMYGTFTHVVFRTSGTAWMILLNVFATKTPANGQDADCSSAPFSVPTQGGYCGVAREIQRYR